MLATVLSLSLLAPQGPAFDVLDNGLRLRRVHVEDCFEEALVLMWPIGSENDPPGRSGLAQAVAELCTMRTSGAMRPQARVHGRFTALHLTVDRARAGEAAALLAALLAAESRPDGDTVARAVARAALRADDLLAILPGPVLRARAGAALLNGTPGARPVGGDPLEVLALDADVLQARRRSCYGPAAATVVGVGGCDEEQWAAVREALSSVPARDTEVPPPVAVEREVGEAFSEHRLVDGPFVAAVFPAAEPAAADSPEFAVAMEILKARALLAFGKYRGGEHRALFPFVGFDWAAGDRLVVLGRRGEDGDRVGRTRAEIEELLASVRAGSVTQRDVSRAARVLASQLALPPYDRATARALSEAPFGLMPRALALALYDRWQWPDHLPHRLLAVRAVDVQAVLERVLHPDGLYWCGLLPVTAQDGTSGR